MSFHEYWYAKRSGPISPVVCLSYLAGAALHLHRICVLLLDKKQVACAEFIGFELQDDSIDLLSRWWLQAGT